MLLIEVKRLKPEKLSVRFVPPTKQTGPVTPRCYTLTHSDRTGELILTIGAVHDVDQVGGWYTRLMRDEVLAEWISVGSNHELHVHCEVGRGLGWASMREGIFRRELDLVLEAIRHGDRVLFSLEQKLDAARIVVHIHMKQKVDDKLEDWGTPSDYS